MRLFQCVALLAVLAVSSSQHLPGHHYPPRKHMSDSALHRFLSSVRGGGRGHRELLTLTGSASSPSYATLHSGGPPRHLPGPSPAFGIGIGRLPPSVTHVPAPPKIGAFYITPPERNAPSYYGGGGGSGGRRPQLVKLTELKNARPLLIAAETSNRPGALPPQFITQAQPQQTVQMYTVNGPLPAGAPGHGLAPQPLAGVPGGIPLGPNVIQSSGPAAGSGSLQEIIAKAAQQQHAMVLAKEQKAHPNAQITNSQILVPGAGQQPVFVNQFGQPFLAPAIFGPGGQQQLLSGPPQHIPPQNLPPQLLANGQALFLPPGVQFSQQVPQQQKPGNVNNEVPEQLLKAQSASPQQQVPIQFLNAGGLQIPQGQAIPLIRGPQGGPHGLPIQFGPQQFSGAGGQIINLPPGIHPGSIAFGNPQGPVLPGNAIFGQPHFAQLGLQELQGGGKLEGIQQQQGRGGSADKEEQPTRPLEAASQQVHSSVPLGTGHGHMTAAIMQSQVEFSEPIVKL